MEQIIVDLPEEQPAGWEPPVLRREETASPQEEPAHAADVFFLQYAAAILLLTALLVLRVFDRNAFAAVIDTFRAQSNSPDLPWADALITYLGSLWS